MKGKLKEITSILCIGALALGTLVGCSQGADSSDSADTSKGKVTIGYVNWSENIATTNLTKAVLEEKMGYEVEMKQGEAGMVFTSLASGDMDVFMGGWLPITHEDYIKKYGEDLIDLGPNFEGARIGLVVPEYVNINKIEDLTGIKDDLEGKIIGIDPGAGIMKTTEKAIEEYGLDYELLEGSGATMTAMLKTAIDEQKPIVVTGWVPHWKFARWDLKFLEDSKNVYGNAENIHTLTRTGFVEDMPEVNEFLDNMQLDEQQLGSLMQEIQDNPDTDPQDVAKAWMANHEELVNSWLPAE